VSHKALLLHLRLIAVDDPHYISVSRSPHSGSQGYCEKFRYCISKDSSPPVCPSVAKETEKLQYTRQTTIYIHGSRLTIDVTMCMASTAYFKGGKKHDSRAELAKEIVPPLFQMWGTIKSISVWGDEIQSLVQYSIKTDVEAKIIFMGPPPVPRWSQKWGALSPHTPRLCRP